MRTIILLLGIALCSPAFAEEPVKANSAKIVLLRYDRDAVIHVCPLGILGCTTKIEIDENEYLLDPLGSAKEEVRTIIEAYRAAGLAETPPGTVTGFFVKEKGHLPNPTVAFKVFKLLTADFPLP
ncbi:MAG TPA: hypothetical protein VKJ47_09730 [Candidatus Binatia bacterium]|nr:hypothetical protein [Candidatus Binatia bacterium]